MCLICTQLEQDKLTPLEARRNLGEMRPTLPPEHVAQVAEKIEEKSNLLWKEATFLLADAAWELANGYLAGYSKAVSEAQKIMGKVTDV